MPATTPSTVLFNPANERQPLLEPRTASAYVDVQPDPELVVSVGGPQETQVVLKKVDFWSILWYLAFATFGGVILAGIIKAFVQNGDIEVRVMVPCSAASRLTANPSVTLL